MNKKLEYLKKVNKVKKHNFENIGDLIGDATSVLDHAENEMNSRIEEYQSVYHELAQAKETLTDFVTEVQIEISTLEERRDEIEDKLLDLGINPTSISDYTPLQNLITKIYEAADMGNNAVDRLENL
tara:strand:- start:9303 stop:9683 length:381 start_codon:yes stop_codon:yes gene_type:complete